MLLRHFAGSNKIIKKQVKQFLTDIIDDISEQVECALSVDETLDGNCDESDLSGTEFEFESVGGRPIGSGNLTYTAIYHTMSPRSVEKQGNIADFEKANIDYNIGDDENTVEASDELDIS